MKLKTLQPMIDRWSSDAVRVSGIGLVYGAMSISLMAAPAPSRDLTVDTSIRNDVIAFWQSTYQASEGYEKRISWTGDYNGDAGKISYDFERDVERRLNYFRAMCGVPANVTVNSGSRVLIEAGDAYKPPAGMSKSAAAQEAALMLILNYNPSNGQDPAISHNPSSTLEGWSKSAWNANAKGNIAFGVFGPGAITEYILEELSKGAATSEWNTLNGHRRWILYPKATDYATGDQPGQSASRPPSNVLYVMQRPEELMDDPAPGFVAYPPPGYVPMGLNSRFWSVSLAGADFSNSNVRVTDGNGNSIPVGAIRKNSNYGDPAIIWEMSGSPAGNYLYEDATYHVRVTDIQGVGVPASIDYSFTLINPDRITSDQAINGPANAITNETTNYLFAPPQSAEEMAVSALSASSLSWMETAEMKSKPNIIDHTGSNYPLMAKMSSFVGFGGVSGVRSFHLTFPVAYDLLIRDTPEQSFELNRLILPGPKARLKFLYRRGFMTKTSTLVVEISQNGGVTWKRVGQKITGVNNTQIDSKTSSAVVRLPKTGEPIRVRFRYYAEPRTPIYTHEASPQSPTGIFIDNITTSNCGWLVPMKTTILANDATNFAFNSSSAGAKLQAKSRWYLGLRTKLGGKWFPMGPVKCVKVTPP